MPNKLSDINILDDLTIRNALPVSKETTLRDGGGLFVLIHPNGSKYFQFRYRINNQAKKLQLGVYPSTSLKEARLKVSLLKNEITTNIDPSVEKRKTKISNNLDALTTFEVVAERWLKDKEKVISAVYHKKIAGMIKANAYPRIGKIPISQISSPIIVETLKIMELRDAVDLMHRVRALLGEIFDYAKALGLYQNENPANCLKKNTILKKHTTKSYQTLKNTNDVGLFLKRLPNYSGSLEVQLLIKLQMLVATRPSEMRTATWDEFNFENKIWTIRPERMKMGIEHTIPLSRQAIEALEKLKKLTGYSKYLFPSHTTKHSLSDGTANKALKILWPEYKIHPHGFRHLFSTHANEHDYRWADIIEAALAHKGSDRIRAVYNRATYIKERRKLAQWYADYLDDLRAKAR